MKIPNPKLGETFFFDGMRFENTCYIAPEQYEVFKKGVQVAYIRNRHGSTTIETPDCGGELVYDVDEETIGWGGVFRKIQEILKELERQGDISSSESKGEKYVQI